MKTRNFIQKCYTHTRAYFLPYYYKYKYNNLGISNSRKKDVEIIVSLTSFPARFPNLHICIKSLLNQTMKPDHVILYLGKDAIGKPLPNKLLKLKKYGLEIIEYVEDIKPHKKYYYAMMSYPKSIVITVDDDCIYDKNLVKDLYSTYLIHPNTVIARNVRIIPSEEKSYIEWEYKSDLEIKSSSRYLAIGLGGVLYPPSILDYRCFDINNIKLLCLNADDIWLKYHELLNNVMVTHCPSIYYMPVFITESIKKSLFHTNCEMNINDTYIKQVGGFYKLNIFCNENKK